MERELLIRDLMDSGIVSREQAEKIVDSWIAGMF